jgi:hypothetical protein
MARSAERLDIGAIATGLRALIRHARTPDAVPPVAVSVLSAAQGTARPGDVSLYNLVLTNNTEGPRWLHVLIDIYKRDNAVHPEGHYAYFDKWVHVGEHASLPVSFSYDWANDATFEIEGVDLPADGVWRGDCRTSGLYEIKAILLSEDGSPRNALGVVQNLAAN